MRTQEDNDMRQGRSSVGIIGILVILLILQVIDAFN